MYVILQNCKGQVDVVASTAEHYQVVRERILNYAEGAAVDSGFIILSFDQKGILVGVELAHVEHQVVIYEWEGNQLQSAYEKGK